MYDVDAALAPGAPLIHDDAGLASNISLDRKIDVGDVDAALAGADYVREDLFTVHAVSHAYLEPCACVAQADPENRVTLWTSTQTPYIVQCLLAATLGLQENQVRVIKPALGGGFGGKMELRPWDFCAAFLARKLRRPVKFVISRQEELAAGRPAPPHEDPLQNRLHERRNHRRQGFRSLSGRRRLQRHGTDRGLSVRKFRRHAVPVSKLPIPGLSRVHQQAASLGHAGLRARPRPFSAGDSQMIMAAEALGMDPIELRLKNAMKTGDEIEGVATISSCGFIESLEKVAEMSHWKEKTGQSSQGQRHWNRLL